MYLENSSDGYCTWNNSVWKDSDNSEPGYKVSIKNIVTNVAWAIWDSLLTKIMSIATKEDRKRDAAKFLNAGIFQTVCGLLTKDGP